MTMNKCECQKAEDSILSCNATGGRAFEHCSKYMPVSGDIPANIDDDSGNDEMVNQNSFYVKYFTLSSKCNTLTIDCPSVAQLS